jgi:hypothetical protein
MFTQRLWAVAWVLFNALSLSAQLNTPTAPPKSPTIYVVLKPGIHEPGLARETFLLRMMSLGLTGIRLFDIGSVTVMRCSALPANSPSITADPDVAGIVSGDDLQNEAIPAIPGMAATQAAAIVPASAIPAPMPPLPQIQTPSFGTPPFGSPPPTGFGTVGFGTGISMGTAMLTDIVSGAIVKMLTQQPGCKSQIKPPSEPIPAAGGSGALEVKVSGNCAWQAVSTADWLHVFTGVQGPGESAISFSVAARAANESPRQAAVILQVVGATGPIRGKTVVTVRQK